MYMFKWKCFGGWWRIDPTNIYPKQTPRPKGECQEPCRLIENQNTRCTRDSSRNAITRRHKKTPPLLCPHTKQGSKLDGNDFHSTFF